jgi:hypothetical protein
MTATIAPKERAEWRDRCAMDVDEILQDWEFKHEARYFITLLLDALEASEAEVRRFKNSNRLHGILEDVSRLVSYDADRYGYDGLADYIRSGCGACTGGLCPLPLTEV